MAAMYLATPPTGGSLESLQPRGLNSRTVSLWRTWKRLSRCQRSICYMIITVLAVIVLYSYMMRDEAMRIPDLTQYDPKAPEMPLSAVLDDDTRQKKALNKVERVHNAIQVPVDEKQNMAQEAVDDYHGDDDDNEGVDAPEENGNDSNQAGEDKDDDDPHNGQQAKSLKFEGPQNERQKAVVEAFQHAWKGYRTYAWGHDHLRPISKSAQNWFGLGLTIVDSLDTMWIMNLQSEFREARDWVESTLDFGVNKDVNFFETTIRVLGGLLGAFHLSGDAMFVDKAKDLGDRLMGAFSSPTGIPYSDVNLRSSRGHVPQWSSDSSTSEVSTIQLEFRDLSRCTGINTYEDAAENVSKKIHDLPKTEGLVPIFINANTGKFRAQSTITLGARGDSYYEYLLKQWIQTGKTQEYLKQDYVTSIQGMNHRLAKRTVPNNLLYFGEILSGGRSFKPKMDELTCFLPGTLALGVHNGLSKDHLVIAEELAYTCYLTFARQPTHLAAEITYFNSDSASQMDFYVKSNDAHYLLRPETIEGLYYLYYFTGNTTYQDWGWKIFQGIEKYTKVRNGYTTIGNVKNAVDIRPKDMMESYFLGETLKYLYLLFADRHEIDLDRWVFNTEAHPLPIRSY
ncbi:hypothetical protein TCAL_13087 [Tigriopus californicus]|uniref:alpha-1,2-Mannosidase n=1 Tax=Tigriopus californicus TaxID=6832 RepID=A0A553NED3_TIGCA|nr:endoplasmic reticulum mannosyl-oligosaccharide 1,2-alpha-mannosidase-like [Tigriopus californicus]TRY63768.1 hypothetical protein TCAL_13087 [Tigriopus californicus]